MAFQDNLTKTWSKDFPLIEYYIVNTVSNQLGRKGMIYLAAIQDSYTKEGVPGMVARLQEMSEEVRKDHTVDGGRVVEGSPEIAGTVDSIVAILDAGGTDFEFLRPEMTREDPITPPDPTEADDVE